MYKIVSKILCLLMFIFSLEVILNKNVSAKSNNLESINYMANNDSINNFRIEVEELDISYLNTNNVNIIMSTTTVVDYTYNIYSENLNISFISNTNNNLVFNVSTNYIGESNGKINFIVDEQVYTVCLYVYYKENNMFISNNSRSDVFERYYYYLYENEIITEGEYEDYILNLYADEADTTDYGRQTIISPNNDVNIYGYIRIKNSNNDYSPLKNVRIDICDKELIGYTILKTLYSESDGYYSWTVSNNELFENGGRDLFIIVYSDNIGQTVTTSDDIQVRNFWRTHRIRSNIFKNYNGVNLPISLDIDYTTIQNNDKDAAKAFMIYETIGIGQKFVYDMDNLYVGKTTVRFPHGKSTDSCYYNSLTKVIHINEDSYQYPDCILHEYGHQLQDYYKTEDNPATSHSSGINMADAYYLDSQKALADRVYFVSKGNAKEKGVKDGWAEAWPTVFAIISQQKYYRDLSSTSYVLDCSYDKIGYSLDNVSHKKGEACERDVMAVLYDLYDDASWSAPELFDNISLTYKQWWDLTTVEDTHTFSDFIDLCYNSNVINNFDLYKLLQEYGFAPQNVVLSENSVNEFFSPKISWDAGGGSTYFPNDEFVIKFYDEKNNLIQTISKSFEINSENNKYEYTLNDSEWNLIMLYNNVRFSVGGSATKDYETGIYYSEAISLSPLTIYQVNIGDTLSNSLVTDGCYWYKFTAPVEGTYQFETSGSVDTYGELFTSIVGNKSIENRLENGYNDDGGDGLNFLLEYNLLANQTVYLRARGWNWTRTGAFSFSVELGNHVHDYTHAYELNAALNHKAYCICGEYILQTHSYSNNVCTKCGNSNSHTHTYKYNSNGNGKTHTCLCSCGYSTTEVCIGSAQINEDVRCLKCKQLMSSYSLGTLNYDNNLSEIVEPYKNKVVLYFEKKDKYVK